MSNTIRYTGDAETPALAVEKNIVLRLFALLASFVVFGVTLDTRSATAAALPPVLSCVDFGTRVERFDAGTVRWTQRACEDGFLSSAGYPPASLDDDGVCTQAPSLTLRNGVDLYCSRFRDFDQLRYSSTRLFCRVVHETWGFENDANLGAVVLECARGRDLVAALGG